jgi:hypothetical protein
MANRWAVANGNWSSTATWNGGTLPTSADDVFSGGFTVTIDQDVTVLSLRNAADTGITAGGGFTLTGNFTVTCTGLGFQANSVNLLTYNGTGTASLSGTLSHTTATTASVVVVTHSSSGTLNISSTAADIVGGNVASRLPVNFTGTGILNVTANLRSATGSAIAMSGIGGRLTITGNLTGVGSVACLIITAGTDQTLTVVGNVQAGVTGEGVAVSTTVLRLVASVTGNITAGTGSNSHGFEFAGSSTGSVTVVGNITGGSGSGGTGIILTGGSNLTVTGNLTGGSGSNTSYGVSASATSVCDLAGTFTASSVGAPSIVNISSATTAINYIRGTAINNGPFMAFLLARMTWGTTGDESLNTGLNTWTFYSANNSPRIMYRPDQFTEFPAASDVALGVTYGPNDEIVGTLVSTPSPSEVAAAVWSYLRTNATTSGSMGERLKDAGTVATTGAQIAGFEV